MSSPQPVNAPRYNYGLSAHLGNGVAGTACKLVGLVMLAIGAWAFCLPAQAHVLGLFTASSAHTWTHLIAGILLLALGFADGTTAALAAVVIGVLYGLFASAAFVEVRSIMARFDTSTADNWLDLLAGAVLLIAGLIELSQQPPVWRVWSRRHPPLPH